MAATAPAKVFTEEQVREEVRKAMEIERKKAERVGAIWEIIAPVADPNHANWQTRDEEGKLNNPYKPTYPADHGTFILQVHPTILRDGTEIPPSTISMFNGRGVTSDENVAKWVKSYYGYAIRQVKAKDDNLKAMELAGQAQE